MEIFNVICLATFGSVMALVGGIMVLAIPSWKNWLTRYSTPFAAGVLLTVSILALIPESFHSLDETAGWWILAGFLFSYSFEWIVCDLHHHTVGESHHEAEQSAHNRHTTTWLLMVGDTVHNFIDGVAIGASYLISPGLAVATAISTFLHEVPHELGDFAVLLDAGWKKAKIIWLNLTSAFATLIGAVSVFWLQPSDEVLGGLIGVSAGLFLYLSASDLLPRSGRKLERKMVGLVFIAGVVLMGSVIWLLPH